MKRVKSVVPLSRGPHVPGKALVELVMGLIMAKCRVPDQSSPVAWCAVHALAKPRDRWPVALCDATPLVRSKRLVASRLKASRPVPLGNGEPSSDICRAALHSAYADVALPDGGPATLRISRSPVAASTISVHDTGSSRAPVSAWRAKTTPSSFFAVER